MTLLLIKLTPSSIALGQVVFMTTWYKLIITIEALRYLPKEVNLPGPCKPAPTYAITQSPLWWGSWKLLFSWLWKGNHKKMPDKKGLAHLGTDRPSSAQRPGWGLTPATVHWLRTHPCYCSLSVEDSPTPASVHCKNRQRIWFFSHPGFQWQPAKQGDIFQSFFSQPARVFSEVPSSLETL